MIDALTRVMTSRDGATAAHARRVERYASRLAHELCAADDILIEAVQTAALLHDIGKLAIPDRLLHKPGPLTREEYEQVKQHAVIGAEMLEGIDFPGPLSLIVRHHHENFDGTGYPDGLSGDRIPLGARILAIVDCYDALTSERPYRKGLPHDRALKMIVERRGTSFDPAVSDAFLRVVQSLRATTPRPPQDPVPAYAFRLRTPRVCCDRRHPAGPDVQDPAARLARLRGAGGDGRRRGSGRLGDGSAVRPCGALRGAARACRADLRRENRPAARTQPVQPVAVARGEFLGALRAWDRPRPSASPRSAAGRSARCAPAAAAIRCTASSSASAA